MNLYERYSAFAFLLRAHDYLWCDRARYMQDRMDACQLLWEIALTIEPGTVLPEEEEE